MTIVAGDVDLSPFCLRAPDGRGDYDLTSPFTVGGWTYATDRILVVRVAAVPGVRLDARAPGNIDDIATCNHGRVQRWVRIDVDVENGPPDEPCEWCGGHGNGAWISDVDVLEDGRHVPGETCVHCGGHGTVMSRACQLTGVGPLAWFNLARLSALPQLEYGLLPSFADGCPVPFRFEWGIGTVMAMGRLSAEWRARLLRAHAVMLASEEEI